MGDLSEFSLSVRLFLKAYRWRTIDPVPWTPLRKPLAESKLAIVSSAGFVLPSQAEFDHGVKGGDSTFRVIPDDADLSTLVESHRSESFDHAGLLSDPSLGLPINRIHELVASGRIGAANHRHLSFMGSITAPGRLIRQTAPEAAEWLVSAPRPPRFPDGSFSTVRVQGPGKVGARLGSQLLFSLQ